MLTKYFKYNIKNKKKKTSKRSDNNLIIKEPLAYTDEICLKNNSVKRVGIFSYVKKNGVTDN